MTDKEARSGYANDFSFNPNWKEQKAVCGYEHCIELMPLDEVRTSKSCRVFGHNCPGGEAMVQKCNKTIDDVSDERIYKGENN